MTQTKTTEQQTPILFYGTKGKYGCFSNFAAYPLTLHRKLWPTTEHYFQAQKFAGTEHEEAIRLARSPMVAARMGRSRQRPLRPDWEQAKDALMLEGLRAKFAQHADIRAVLLATSDARIVEHTPKDRYWGDGGDGSGKNMLGMLLMRVRDEMQGQHPETTLPTAAPQTASKRERAADASQRPLWPAGM